MKRKLYYKSNFITILIMFTVYPFLSAQNVGISDNGATPNSSAMLDIVSPATGDGKGLLIPRITEAQRITANSGLAGGLLDDSGNLRGGIAQGLLIYQINGTTEGFYYNTSTTVTPNWVYIGTGSINSITAGAGLDGGVITSSGTISMSNTGTSGTYTKVTTDSKGRVTSGTALADTDIPDIDTSKITTGTLSAERGGLGTDVSAFSGLPYIDGGSASQVSLTNPGRNLIDDATVVDQRTTLGLGNIATQNIPYILQNANGNSGQVLVTNGAGLANWNNLVLPNTGTSGTYTKVTTDSKGRVTSGTALADTDIPDIDTSKITTGTLSAERGGLGTDVSAFSGLAYIDGGSAVQVSLTNPGRNLIDDATVADQRTTLGLGNIATQNITYTLQNANGINGQFMQTDGAGSATWQTVQVPIIGSVITIGNSATTTSNGIAIGVSSNGNNSGTALGYRANSGYYGAALGYKANANDCNVALGYCANGYAGSGPYAGAVSIGYRANSYSGDGKYTGGIAVGYRANARHNFNEHNAGAVAIGFMSNSFIKGAAVGYGAAGYNKGVALGYLASGSNYGVGIGYMANGAVGSYGTAIGYMANGGGSKNYTFAKGAYSKCERYNEEWKSSDGYNNKFGYGKLNFHGTTTTGNVTEIFLGGVTNKRFVLKDNSAVTFQALITGINSSGFGHSSGWRCWGVIKRRFGTASTALIGTVTIDAKTQPLLTISPSFTADTSNGSLKLRVTGVNGTTVFWNAAIDYSEIRQDKTQ